MRMALFHIPVCLSLAACGAWPDLPQTANPGGRDGWPELLPVSEIYPVSPTASEPDTGAERLEARAADLRRRASVLRTPVADQDGFAALRDRLGG